LALAPSCQQHAQRLFVVGHGGDGHGVVAVVFQQAQVRAGRGQAADRVALARKGCHVHRGAAVGSRALSTRRGRAASSAVQRGQVARCAAACRPV
jgi:hypothetical protein